MKGIISFRNYYFILLYQPPFIFLFWEKINHHLFLISNQPQIYIRVLWVVNFFYAENYFKRNYSFFFLIHLNTNFNLIWNGRVLNFNQEKEKEKTKLYVWRVSRFRSSFRANMYGLYSIYRKFALCKLGTSHYFGRYFVFFVNILKH